MPVEEDIGGLKADMRTVTEQTSAIFHKIDDLTSSLSERNTKEEARLSILEERQKILRSHIEDNINPAVESIKNAKGYMLGLGGGAAIGGVGIIEAIKHFFKGVS